MREIKFRLRNKDNNIVGYEKWYCGSYLREENRYDANPCWLYSTDNKHWTPKYIKHRYKDQYTGLKDKNGKEIYEGDKLRFVGGTADCLRCGVYESDVHRKGTILIVKYLKSGFTLQLPEQKSDIPNMVGNVTQYDFWNHQGSLEVVGNIYEDKK